MLIVSTKVLLNRENDFGTTKIPELLLSEPKFGWGSTKFLMARQQRNFLFIYNSFLIVSVKVKKN